MRNILMAWLVMGCLTILAAAQTPFHVGVTDRAFLKGDSSYDWRGAKTHALITTIWYPAVESAQETKQWIGDPAQPFAIAGTAARDARLAASPAKFPLILLSHGTGGSALMMAWLGTQLAAHGYIAAAVNHPGNNALEPYTIQGFTLGWERAVDLSRALDGMLADPEFRSRIDAGRVGAAGFSFGGYTMMVLAGGVGGIANPKEIEARCGEPRATDPLCFSPPEFPDLVRKAIDLFHTDASYGEAMKQSERSHADPRIRAVFAIAPAVGKLSPESLGRISIPVEIVAGASDPLLPPAANAGYLAAHIPSAKQTIYPGGVAHYTFLATCTEMGVKQNPVLCGDLSGVNRNSVHSETGQKAVAFFDRNLKR
jgi:predicted dienelactone hydrolase